MFYSASTNGFYSIEIHGENIPEDAVEIAQETYEKLLDGQSKGRIISSYKNGNPKLIDPVVTEEQLIAKYERLLDSHMDSVAKQHRYDNRFTFALRAGYDGPYKEEGIRFAQWMDNCNVMAFDILQKVQNKESELPSETDFIEMLPVFE